MKTIALMLALALTGCQPRWTSHTSALGVPSSARQLLEVQSFITMPRAQLTAWERNGDAWQPAFPPMPAVVGHKGVAPAGLKREGDGRTPFGVFRLKQAFGSTPRLTTGIEYRQATDEDFWIDDPQAPTYNRWVHCAKPTCSHEVLRRVDGQYDLAAVIEYNTEPVIAGHGSAIFLHIWKQSGEGTTGCVALDRGDVAKLLAWLDAKKSPVVAIH